MRPDRACVDLGARLGLFGDFVRSVILMAFPWRNKLYLYNKYVVFNVYLTVAWWGKGKIGCLGSTSVTYWVYELAGSRISRTSCC